MPTHVDEVLEFDYKTRPASITTGTIFPTTGTAGIIYIDKSTNKTYRWGGTLYVEISQSIVVEDNLNSDSSANALSAKQGKQLKSEINNKTNTTVTDNLTSNSATSALSAKQGKALEDKKLNKDASATNKDKLVQSDNTLVEIVNDLNKTTVDGVLDARQGKILEDKKLNKDSSTANKEKLVQSDNTLVPIVDNLTTTSEGVLSANQGKTLKSQLDTHNHDSRYFTETEVTTKLNAKLNKGTTKDIVLSDNSTIPQSTFKIEHQSLANYYNKTATDAKLATKVDKVTGKVLSDNSFTDTEKTKVSKLKGIYNINSTTTPVNLTNSGKVTIYELLSLDTRSFDLTNTLENETYNFAKFGTSIAFSDDGSILVAGYPYYKNSTGITVGQVKVFEKNSNNIYAQKGSAIQGNSTTLNVGKRVAINQDGTWFVTSNEESYALTYEYKNNDWVQFGSKFTGTASSKTGKNIHIQNYGTSDVALIIVYDKSFSVHKKGTSSWEQVGTTQDLTTETGIESSFRVSRTYAYFGIGTPKRGIPDAINVGAAYLYKINLNSAANQILRYTLYASTNFLNRNFLMGENVSIATINNYVYWAVTRRQNSNSADSTILTGTFAGSLNRVAKTSSNGHNRNRLPGTSIILIKHKPNGTNLYTVDTLAFNNTVYLNRFDISGNEISNKSGTPVNISVSSLAVSNNYAAVGEPYFDHSRIDVNYTPATGNDDEVYRDLRTNDLFIWDGTKYTPVDQKNTINSSRVVNNLTTSSSFDALSALQGKLLNDKKVEAELGKTLTSNDFTDTLKTKLENIGENATTTLVTSYSQETRTNSGKVQFFKFVKDKPVEHQIALFGNENEHLGSQVSLSLDGNNAVIGSYDYSRRAKTLRVHYYKKDSSGIFKAIGAPIRIFKSLTDNEFSLGLFSINNLLYMCVGLPTATGEPSNINIYLISNTGRFISVIHYNEPLDRTFGKKLAVGVSGNTARIAVYQDTNTNSGKVTLYTFDGIDITKIAGSIDGSGTDKLGNSLALSSDGSLLAVGSDSDYVLTHTVTNTAFSKFGSTLAGDTNSGFGKSVAIEGRYLVIGAPTDSNKQGKVYIYYKGNSSYNLSRQITGQLSDEELGSQVSIDSTYLVISNGLGNTKTTLLANAHATIHTLNHEFNSTDKTLRQATTGGILIFGYPQESLEGFPETGDKFHIYYNKKTKLIYYWDNQDNQYKLLGEFLQKSQEKDNDNKLVEGNGHFLSKESLVKQENLVQLQSFHSESTTLNSNPGYISIFEREGGIYREIDKIYGTENQEKYGNSVSISSGGDFILVGIPAKTVQGRLRCGQAILYKRGGKEFSRVEELAGSAAGDHLGTAVAASTFVGFPITGVFAIGSPFSAASHNNGGKVTAYKYEANRISEISIDFPNGLGAGDEFGHSVAITGNGLYLAVGAIAGGTNNGGYVTVYKYDALNSQYLKFTTLHGESTGDKFGWALYYDSLGTNLFIGAKDFDYNSSVADSGKVYQYTLTQSSYRKDAELTETTNLSHMGSAISRIDSLIISTGIGNTTSSRNKNGEVKITNTAFRTLKTIVGENVADNFGKSVATGQVGRDYFVAVGAPGSDANGNNSGKLYIYKVHYFIESHVTAELIQEFAGHNAGNEFGHAMSMSADASILVVGAYNGKAQGFPTQGELNELYYSQKDGKSYLYRDKEYKQLIFKQDSGINIAGGLVNANPSVATLAKHFGSLSITTSGVAPNKKVRITHNIGNTNYIVNYSIYDSTDNKKMYLTSMSDNFIEFNIFSGGFEFNFTIIKT